MGDQTWQMLLARSGIDIPQSLTDNTRASIARNAGKPPNAEVEHVLGLAIRQIGLKEVPTGSNGGPEIAHIVDPDGLGAPPSPYYSHWRIDLDRMPPWCVLFISWAIREGTGAKNWKQIPFGNWFGGVAQLEEWAKMNGCWRPATDLSAALPGAVFTMGRGGSSSDPSTSVRQGHAGFVTRTAGGRVETVEGNVGNAVGSRRRDIATLRGFVHWWEGSSLG